MPPFPLETDRLSLRCLEPADAGAVESYAADRAVARHLANVPYPYPVGLAAAWIEESRRNIGRGDDYALAVTARGRGALVGTVHLKVPDYREGGEIGYWIGRPFWGRGYATEAVRTVVVFAFNRLGLHRVWAAVRPDNPASARVVEKAGLEPAGTGDYDFPAQGGRKPVVFYALTRSAAATAPALGAVISRV